MRPLLPPEQWAALYKVLGLKGQAARRALSASPTLRFIKISRAQATVLLPIVAAPYWAGIAARFPILLEAPPAVQTALLSLAYNRGVNNKGLEELRSWITLGDWRAVGTLIQAMQQDHPLKGIRDRRWREGQLILDSLEPEG